MIINRADLEQHAPEAVTLFKRLASRIDAAAMRTLNARVKLNGDAEAVWYDRKYEYSI